MFFFSPRKQKFNPRKFSILCPRSLKSSREKILKTAREDTFLPEKKTAKFNPRKNNPCPRKKYTNTPLIITKIPSNSKISAREKQIFNPRKNLKICPRKRQNSRENFGKSGREKHFLPEKKTKKVRKTCFLGHFSFSREKKKNTGRHSRGSEASPKGSTLVKLIVDTPVVAKHHRRG